MLFALLALKSIELPPKGTAVPTRPILKTNNDDEELGYIYVLVPDPEHPGENKFSLKKVVSTVKKVVDVVDKVVNDDEDEDSEYEIYYEIEEAPEYGENKFSFKKIFKKLGKVVKVVTKVVKIGSKVVSAITNDETVIAHHKGRNICKYYQKPGFKCPKFCDAN
ncbi:hypothetical protein GPJ56_000240 [Histomonas meleagridis]|uniref:uncharacterized protein n=1 Tax=Histomonas meleagridis TaxID=135588 RepID=UPI0035597E3B|nr:hypothetical protein GPJ56_000240 [Histomonas meleagridis]KAH0799727.1 hypothetical protein GO595_007448 [Histomonas meleagridis]